MGTMQKRPVELDFPRMLHVPLFLRHSCFYYCPKFRIFYWL